MRSRDLAVQRGELAELPLPACPLGLGYQYWWQIEQEDQGGHVLAKTMRTARIKAINAIMLRGLAMIEHTCGPID
jgi:hypothetical protein